LATLTSLAALGARVARGAAAGEGTESDGARDGTEQDAAPSDRKHEAFEALRAKWLAGMVPAPDCADEAWQAFARVENERWAKGEARRVAMAKWAKLELLPSIKDVDTLLYPFAGPDAFHALALFGAQQRLVLIGLEPVGQLPQPNAGVAPGYFERLGAAMTDLHRLTFFRTFEMSSQFAKDGVAAALIATIARMGGEVSSVRVNAEPPHLRVQFTTEGKRRELEYVCADLSNAGLARAPLVLAFLRRTGPGVAFVKSAMYLLADTRFSEIRQHIIERSTAILQDDTGIPFRAFDAHWTHRLYGAYDVPAKPFEDRVQPALRAAYESRRAGPLPFGIGYGMQTARSNLLLAIRGAT
jgi:hypothetical protein